MNGSWCFFAISPSQLAGGWWLEQASWRGGVPNSPEMSRSPGRFWRFASGKSTLFHCCFATWWRNGGGIRYNWGRSCKWLERVKSRTRLFVLQWIVFVFFQIWFGDRCANSSDSTWYFFSSLISGKIFQIYFSIFVSLSRGLQFPWIYGSGAAPVACTWLLDLIHYWFGLNNHLLHKTLDVDDKFC